MTLKNEIGRIEAFSDGVFAIAITLLVLEIKVPPVSSIHSVNDLWHALKELWPSYFAYILSFGFILIAWVNHHTCFNLVEHSSPSFMFANGFLLFNIAIIPFPTALLAEYITTDYAQPAVVFYCFCYILQNLSWNLLFVSMKNSGLLKDNKSSSDAYSKFTKYSKQGAVLYLCITVLAWWFPKTALFINSLLWFVWLWLGIKNPLISKHS